MPLPNRSEPIFAVEHLCREIVPRLRPELLVDHPISIVGDGLDDAIRRYADGLPGVRMIGWVPDVVPYLQRARVSLVPLQFGAGTKRKMIQTLIAGTPCVSTDVAGIPEILRDGDTGLLVPPHDPRALAAALERPLRDADLRVDLAKRARALVEANFNVRPNAGRLRELFEAAGRTQIEKAVVP